MENRKRKRSTALGGGLHHITSPPTVDKKLKQDDKSCSPCLTKKPKSNAVVHSNAFRASSIGEATEADSDGRKSNRPTRMITRTESTHEKQAANQDQTQNRNREEKYSENASVSCKAKEQIDNIVLTEQKDLYELLSQPGDFTDDLQPDPNAAEGVCSSTLSTNSIPTYHQSRHNMSKHLFRRGTRDIRYTRSSRASSGLSAFPCHESDGGVIESPDSDSRSLIPSRPTFRLMVSLSKNHQARGVFYLSNLSS